MEFQPKRILAGIDFSDMAPAVARSASTLASRFGASLHLVYADRFVPPIDFMEAPAAFYMENLPKMKEAAEAKLASFAADHVRGVPHVATVAVDAASESLLRISEEEQSDLIVLGTHGRSGLRRALMGSVAERVLRETSRPVMTIRSPDAPDLEGRKIVCPTNYSEVAMLSLRAAAAVARACKASLLVVHVVEEERAEESAAVERLRAWVPPDIRDCCCGFEELALKGNAAAEVIAFAKKSGAGLIVMGAQHERFYDTTVIGTTTERVTRHSPTPVLTVIGPSKEPATSGTGS